MSQELELARARAKAKLKLRQKQEAMTHTAPVVEEPQMENIEISTSPLEAGARAAYQAATFDFGDEINAGLAVAAETVEKGEFQTFEEMSNTYNKNLEESRQEFAINKQMHPTADNIGTGVGVAGSLLLPGGVVAKGATAGAKAISAAKIGAAYGAFGAIGRSEDKLSLEGALDAAEGALVGAVGGAAISKGISAAQTGYQKVAQMFPNTEPKRLINMAFKGIGLRTESAKKKFADELKRKGVQPIDWLKRISKETDVDGKRLIGDLTESYSDIYMKAENKIKQYAIERDNILKNVNVKLNREDVAKQLKSALVNSKGSTVQDASYLNNLIDDIVVMKKGIIKSKDQGEVLGKVIDESPLDALGLSSIRKSLDSGIKFDSVTNANAVKKDLRNIFNELTDDLVANNLDDAAKSASQALRGKMSDLYSLQNSLEKGIDYEQFGDTAMIKDLVAGAKAKMMTSFMGPGAQQAAAVAGIVLRQMSVSPRLNRNLSFNAMRLAESLPNIAETSLRRLLSIAETGDIKEFNQAAAGVLAESDLKISPVKRSYDNILSKKESIIALANDRDPEMGQGLAAAFEADDKETVLNILSNLSKSKDIGKFFEPGVGFDGKVYTPEDAAQLEEQLKKSDIPAAQRQTMLQNLRETGTIPDFDNVVRPVPQPHVPRTKKIHNY